MPDAPAEEANTTLGEILPGAEPYSAAGSGDGVLVLHGFTGTPQSMRGLAHAFAAAGFSIELPLLPGHGTTVQDMAATGWEDWSSAAEAAFTELESRCARVAVAGLSMGGALACWLAARHPNVAGLVVVNPAVEPPGQAFVDILHGLLAQGVEVAPAIGNDVADPSARELAYDAVPVRCVLSLANGQMALAPLLGQIRCPTLVITSRNDHVVPTSASDLLAAAVTGPVERVWLERSYHVATLDHDRDEIETRAATFLTNAFAR
ncbi:MAG: alpha/beta fold hydrolase [Actinobacteria bacterium]|nr:alpha/beta fold hydrolase [Actinomycetota bacterium]